MRRSRLSHDVLLWLAVITVLSTPQGAILWLDASSRDVDASTAVSGVMTYVGLSVAALLWYLYWRMTDGNPNAWLVCGLTAVSVQGFWWSALVVAGRTPISDPGWSLATDLAISCLLLSLVAAADRVTLTLDPLIVGLAAGGLLAAVRVLPVELVAPLELGDVALAVALTLFVVVQVAVATALLWLHRIPLRLRRRLTCAAILITLGHVLHYGEAMSTASGLVSILTSTSGTVLFLVTVGELLRGEIREQLAVMTSLEERLIDAESGIREERARMHEIRATVAGITSASHLLNRRHALSWDRRQQLERMVEAELGRLGRLMGGRRMSTPHVFLVDKVLEPLVHSHHAQDHRVHWEPSGARAIGRPDDLVEVVNILLTNAARHGGARGTRLLTRQERGGAVEIVVMDSGPGVSRALRRRLFEWGMRGPQSDGQGIGLHIAQQLMAEQSGSLELDDSLGAGATFVVRLPGPDEGHDGELAADDAGGQ